MATPEQLAEVYVLMPQIGERIEAEHIDVIASNLDLVLFRDFTVRQFLPYMTKVARASRYDLLDLVRTINDRRP